MIKTSHSRLQDNKNMIKHLLIGACLVFTSQVSAEILQGRVVAISDGDTLTLLDDNNTQHKVRLTSIDAPEKRQPFGQASKESLSQLVFGKAVQVDWSKKDRYKRILGKVLINGSDANLEQIKRGLAWHYSKYMKEQPYEERVNYIVAQTEAKTRRLGLWSQPNPVAPWGWRKQARELLN